MHKINRLTTIWRNKIFRFAQHENNFESLINEFDRPSFLATEPDSGPKSMPISSGPRSMKDNISAETISNPQGMNNLIVSQLRQEFENLYKNLEEKLSGILEPLNSHYETKKAEVVIIEELKKLLSSLPEAASFFQAAIMDIYSGNENKLSKNSKNRLAIAESKFEILENKSSQLINSRSFEIWSANKQFKDNIKQTFHLITKIKNSIGILKGILSNEE